MPLEFEFGGTDWDVEIRIRGVVGMQDVLDHFEALKSHPSYRPELRVLADFEGADLRRFGSVSVERVAKLTKQKALLTDCSAVAMVATQPVAYGLARMFELISSPAYRFSVFRTRPEAATWLAHPPATQEGSRDDAEGPAQRDRS